MKNITTLEQTMGICFTHKEDLLKNAWTMGFNSDGEWDDLKAPQIRKKLAKAVLDNPQQVLRQLPEEDLMLLHTLKDAAPGLGMSMHSTSHVMTMALLGLADQYELKDEKMMDMVSITEDFKEAIRPYVDEIMDDPEVKFRFTVEEYLIGALNLYGILNHSELKAILKECLELEDDGSGLFDHIYPNSIALKTLEYDGMHSGDEVLYISPFAEFFGVVIKERDKRKDITTRKHFSRDTIRKAGQMPIPHIPNPLNKKLINTLRTTLGYTGQMPDVVQFRMWQMAQEGDVNEILQLVLEDAPKGNNERAINDALPVLSDFLNNAPRWIFRGRCPSDLYVPPTSAPTISLGPNMRNAGFNDDDFQQVVNAMWNSKKVGRNDPCPCGSGKKYKHCCGRNN